MANYNYKKFKIRIDKESKKTQGLRQGDVVRRQYLENSKSIYSLMIVLDEGVEVIGDTESPFFIGALIEGDEPQNGELLNFVRVTNLFNEDRTGALYLTSSDSDSPYIDIIDSLSREYSVCYPTTMLWYWEEEGFDNSYRYIGEGVISAHYNAHSNGISRVFRMECADLIDDYDENSPLGLCTRIAHINEEFPRVIISYKIRASHELKNIKAYIGNYYAGEKDGETTIDISTDWEYKVHVISCELPSYYERNFLIDLKAHFSHIGNWCEIAELNIIVQSDLASFAKASKVRLGKIKGIIDPIFGVLDGYGAYFQNMYATKNVNIAGTLTAADQNGFSSTFYVGKIQKNVIVNSMDCLFLDKDTREFGILPPVGIGKTYLIRKSGTLNLQDNYWHYNHLNQIYCFSIWVLGEQGTITFKKESGEIIFVCEYNDLWDWERLHFSFPVWENDQDTFNICIEASYLYVCSPQLEPGSIPTFYQPTDGVLSYDEGYGAWFSKGGIGGTIQNPLLKLNSDGSISSKDNSFVINQDGTGHFASGRFTWTKNTITLKDVTIKWEDFDDKTKDTLLPKSVTLTGPRSFHYPDSIDSSVQPQQIMIMSKDINFVSYSWKWYYQSPSGYWVEIPNTFHGYVIIDPDDNIKWCGRNSLTIKYASDYDGITYECTHTIDKQYDGQDSILLFINSSKGVIFKNKMAQTILSVTVYKGGINITELIPDESFRWIKSSDEKDKDSSWNSQNYTGKEIILTESDVCKNATFDCELNYYSM